MMVICIYKLYYFGLVGVIWDFVMDEGIGGDFVGFEGIYLMEERLGRKVEL